MNHDKVASDLTAAREANPDWFNAQEGRTRQALEWALENTCLAIPPGLRTAAGWRWDADDVSLCVSNNDGDFRFHVAGERRRSGKVRIAIMSWEDGDGKATWEAEMPEAAA